MVPLIGPGFKPTDRDEQGLWKEMERAEEEISGSNLVIEDPRLNEYLQNLIGTVGGPAARDFRIYLLRIPDFNAMMFPSGFAVVFSGLLLRMRNEAQLAGVIAHESGHFLRRHQIRSWRDMRRKTDLFAIGAMLAGVGGAGAGVYLGDYVQLAQLGTLLSLFQYSREMEAEADAIGVKLIAEAGYPPMEMSNIWQQLIGEEAASARYRGKHRDRGGLFDTHPSSDARMADLRADAEELTVPGKAYDSGRERYLVDDRRHPADPARRSGQAQRPGRKPVSDRDPGAGWLERAAALLRRRGVAAAQPARRPAPRGPELCRRGRLSGCAGRRLAVARDSLMKQGRSAEAKAAFARYLTMKPDAPDAAWVLQMAG